MNKIFYIADLHCGHSNVVKYDKRPFYDIKHMESVIVENWNNIVDENDFVYILGDFCWGKTEEWIRIIDKLKGKKVLVRGNHDLKKYPKKLEDKFQSITNLKEIDDNGRKVILCHYPIPFYRRCYDKNTYMLYGHLHNTIEESFMQYFKEYVKTHDTRSMGKAMCQWYNVGCNLPYMNYTPKTLDEIIEGAK